MQLRDERRADGTLLLFILALCVGLVVVLASETETHVHTEVRRAAD